jgi:hypothetical protein
MLLNVRFLPSVIVFVQMSASPPPPAPLSTSVCPRICRLILMSPFRDEMRSDGREWGRFLGVNINLQI